MSDVIISIVSKHYVKIISPRLPLEMYKWQYPYYIHSK